MSRYVVEFQMGGEITIDTAGTDWTPEEVEEQVGQALLGASDRPADDVADEFDDCEVEGVSATVDYKVRTA